MLSMELFDHLNPSPLVFSPLQFNNQAGLTNGVNDDTVALQWAVSKAVACNGAVWLGSGKYRITAPIGTMITQPISIIGAGLSNCWIIVDKAMTGDVLSFSNTWYGSDVTLAAGGGTQPGSVGSSTSWASILGRKSAVTLENFTITGDRTTTNPQNGIVFYDRNDAAKIRNVEVNFIKGLALCLSGIPSNPANNIATVAREMDVYAFQARWCGDKARHLPAVMLVCNSKTAISADDGNNYNFIRGMKIVFSDGVAFQDICFNTNDNQASHNDIEVIIDFPQGLSSAEVNSGFTSIANGVMTISAGASITRNLVAGDWLEVGQYVNNAAVPPGTYISAILTGSGGVGTYQLGNNTADVSGLTVVAGVLFSVRTNIPFMQIDGGHVGCEWKIALNGSNTLGTGGCGLEFNHNCLGATTPKTQQCTLDFSCGQMDTSIIFTVIHSLDVKWKVRNSVTSITSLLITQSVTVNLMEELFSARIAIGGVVDNLHVYPGGQSVVRALPQANKYPNAFLVLNTAGVYTRHVSDGTNWITI